MKSLIDMLPALLFLAALFLADIYTATAVLMACLVLLAGWYWWREGKPHKLHTFSAMAVLVLGGLTLILKDDSFVKLKPTVVNGVVALVFLGSHVIGDKVLLQRLPQEVLKMPDPVWRRVNFAWAVFFACVAVLNLWVAHNFSTEVWGTYKTVGVSVLMFVFMLGHLPFLARYVQHDETPPPPPKAN